MEKEIVSLLQDWGINAEFASIIYEITGFIAILIISALAYWICRKILISVVQVWVRKSKTKWDDVLIEYRFFRKLSLFVPVLVIYYATPYVLDSQAFITHSIIKVCQILEVFIFAVAVASFGNAINHIYSNSKISQQRSIKGIIQLVQVLVYVIGGIIAISIILDMETKSLIVGLGGFSAVLLLVFKDSILGFVGGLQLASNNIVLIGDWISMPQYGADGVVEDISLVTVKVRNWDKTITTIPTYNLISSPLTNWRGMEESGGRRIKRSFNIDMNSVHFLSPEEITHLSQMDLLTSYIKETEEKIKLINEKNGVNTALKSNGKRQTNLGAFRAYLKQFLLNHQDIHTDMTFLVRQLQPTEKGIPMEIYVFSKIQAWSAYEDIQSDITDHVLAAIEDFNLQVFQLPSGSDIKLAIQG